MFARAFVVVILLSSVPAAATVLIAADGPQAALLDEAARLGLARAAPDAAVLPLATTTEHLQSAAAVGLRCDVDDTPCLTKLGLASGVDVVVALAADRVRVVDVQRGARRGAQRPKTLADVGEATARAWHGDDSDGEVGLVVITSPKKAEEQKEQAPPPAAAPSPLLTAGVVVGVAGGVVASVAGVSALAFDAGARSVSPDVTHGDKRGAQRMGQAALVVTGAAALVAIVGLAAAGASL